MVVKSNENIQKENEQLKKKISELEKQLQYYEAEDVSDKKSELEQLEWMLKSKNIGKEDFTPDYGDLSELNKDGLILSSVGKEQLKAIASEYLDLLETSAAIYEINGDYALGLFSSGWCRLLDSASRKLCNTKSKQKALDSGKWLCHESCWKDASLECIKKEQPVDIECNGGLKIYAIPVRANGKIVGAINFGYGNPPTDEKELKKLSEKYKIPEKKLKEAANAYQKRPPFIIELAKQRIKVSASRIGRIIEIKQAQKGLQERIKELRCLYTIANLSEETNISTDNFLQKAVDAIPDAWQYPEITCARIMLNDKIFKTKNFKETQWSQKVDLYIHNKKAGSIDVYYLEEKPDINDGPFLKEEISLLNTIGKNISQYLERKQVELEKRQSEENLRITLNSIGDAVIATDVNGHIIQINPIAEKLTGWNRKEALKKHIDTVFNICDAQTGEYLENPVKKVLENGEIVGLGNHTKLISKNGNEYQITDSGSPIKNSLGETVGVVLVFRDVTDEYRMLEELKESESKHKSLFNSIRDAIMVADTDRKITQCNPAFFELFGYSKEEIIGKETSYIYKNLDEFKLMGQKIKENMDNPNFLLPVSFKKKNGTVFIGETNVFYLKNSKGEVEGFIGMIRDITEKIKTGQALQQNEERFRKIVEGAPTPIFIQTEMKFSYLNPVACKLFGIKSQDELLGKPVMDRFHPDFHDEIYDRIHRLNEGRQSVSKLFEQKFIRVDGSEVWVETVGEPINYDGKDGALVFVRDISERKEAEQKLKESEQKYRTIFENTGTATCILEKDGTISLANTKFAQLAGYPLYEIENKKTWMEFVDPEDLEWMYQQHELRRKNRQEAITEYEFRFIDTNKKAKNIFLTIDVIPGTQQSVASLLDITEKGNAEKALQQSEERFRNLFENMSSCVAVYQAVDNGNDFVMVDFNAAAEKAEKISENELLGKYVTEVFPGIKEFGLLDVFKRVWKTGKPEYHPVKEYKDNRIVGWRENYVYKLPSGEIVALYDDVTKQRKAEMALKESEAQFRNLFETMAQGVVYQNAKGEITMANKAAEEILGLSFEQMIGKKSVDPEWRAVDKDKKELPGEKHPAMIALKTGKSIENFIQGIFNPKKNDYVWIIVNSKPQFKKGSKKPWQVFSTFLDITERKKAEEALQESEERFKALHNASFGGIAIHDKGIILECNQGLSDITGYSLDELIGMDGLLLIAPESRGLAMQNIIQGYEKPYEAIGLRKNGEKFALRLEARNVPYKGKQVRTVEFRDITESKKAEEVLRESEQRHRALIEQMQEGLLVVDNNDIIKFVNPAFCKMLGYKDDELLGRVGHDVLINENDRELIIQKNLERKQEISEIYEINMRTKSGDQIVMLMNANPVLDNKGRVTGSMSTCIDITDRKKAEDELRKLKENLEKEVEQKTKELQERVADLERFQEATIEREFRIKELRDEIELLKQNQSKK